jgi:hypothetical protein
MSEHHPRYVDILARTRMEREILLRLLKYCDEIEDWPWRPIEEVMDSTAEPITALDAIAALCEAGLLQRKGEFVMASSIAYRFYQLIAGSD